MGNFLSTSKSKDRNGPAPPKDDVRARLAAQKESIQARDDGALKAQNDALQEAEKVVLQAYNDALQAHSGDEDDLDDDDSQQEANLAQTHTLAGNESKAQKPVMSAENRENVFAQLKIDEGVEYRIYLDSSEKKNPTFGVGHLILATDEEYGKPVGTAVSEERVKACFMHDLDTHIEECLKLYKTDWAGFPGEVQEILVNMMFNMGFSNLSTFINFNKEIRKKNWKEAAEHGRDSDWYDQVETPDDEPRRSQDGPGRAERLMQRLEALK